MRRLLLVALTTFVVLPAGGLLGTRVAHAATAPLPAGTCQTDSSANCRSYIVPTSVLDANGNPVDIYLEVRHATDSGGNIIAAPTILTYSPYAVLGRNGDAAHWNSLGFTRAYADAIGTGNSGGCWDYGGPKEKQAGYDAVEAIAAQPWSDGHIGMLGGSYDGTTQYMIATAHPPHLDTIVPEAAIDRWYDYAFANGVRYSYTTEPFGYEGPGTAGDEGIDTPAGFDFGLDVPPPVDEQDPTWATRVQSRIAVCDEVEHTQYGYSTTPAYTQFWLDRDYLKDLPHVTIPVLVASNYGDWNVKQVDAWQAYHALTGSSFARLYMGSRWHGHGVPPGQHFNDTVDAWFQHFLQGANNGLEQTLPPVTTATTDSNGPKDDTYSSGPEPTPTAVPLYLGVNADGTWKLSPDADAAPAGSPAATLQWTGTNTESNAVLHPFASDPRYLSFVSAPLSQDVRIFGEPTLHLWSTIQRTWITYTPRLLDFDPSRYTGTGAATVATTNDAIPAMTRGWVDTRFNDPSPANPGPGPAVTPGQAFPVDINLWPQDYTVRTGHRLVLLLSTETTDWDVSKLASSTDAGAPSAQVAYENGQSWISVPMVGVTSGDAIFGPANNVPEVPTAALLLLAGPLALVPAARRRRRSMRRASHVG